MPYKTSTSRMRGAIIGDTDESGGLDGTESSLPSECNGIEESRREVGLLGAAECRVTESGTKARATKEHEKRTTILNI